VVVSYKKNIVRKYCLLYKQSFNTLC